MDWHDLHKKESQICIFTEEGEVLEKRIMTQKHRFHDELGKRKGKVRILIEASTESEWVARCGFSRKLRPTWDWFHRSEAVERNNIEEGSRKQARQRCEVFWCKRRGVSCAQETHA